MQRATPKEEGAREAMVPAGVNMALSATIRVRVIEGPDTGTSRESRSGRLVIGTHPSSDLVLTDRSVSRFHCELTVEEGTLTVRDLGSRNGTTVAAVRVLHAPLTATQRLGLGVSRLQIDPKAAPGPVSISPRDRFGTLVGCSVALRRVFDQLEKAAVGRASVLIEGEPGTGKEAAAEALHQTRGLGSFVVLDIGAVPPDQLESELFGHEPGSFPGAVGARPGAVERARGGTLFLDQVGHLPSALQPRLLRLLEHRESRRLGQSVYTPIDVRVIAGSNRSLRAEVNAGRFRSELYYRLAAIEIRMPPLRERPEDLPLLVTHLLEQMHAPRAARRRLSSPDFLAGLVRHRWTGNVGELHQYLEEHLHHGDASPEDGEDDDGPPTRALQLSPYAPLREARATFEETYLRGLLAACQNDVAAAARQAGVDRMSFDRLLRKHGLREWL